MIEQTMFLLAMVCLIGIACQWLAWVLKIPAILLLLLAGIIVGPLTGVVEPDVLFGDLLFPVVSLSVAVILFEGGLTLRVHELREVGHVVRNLVTFGAVITWLVIAFATHRLLDFPPSLALLFGALVVVTGPTVIVPLLRTVRPQAHLANILRWEGILIDPLGALLAVLVYDFIVSGLVAGRHSEPLVTFASIIGIGTVSGVLGALGLGFILRRHLLPEYLINVATLAIVLSIYAIANQLAHESGLLAVTVMGMLLANLKQTPIEGILDFKESLSVLLISLLFILLAARIDFSNFSLLGSGAIAVILVVIFVARPLAVFVSALGAGLGWRDQMLLAWIAPRGIVAAAVSALFALRLQDLGVDGASLLIPLTFMVIIVTVVLQSLTARPLARLLGLAEPEPRGVLIVGAHAVARAIAAELQELEFRVLLADTNWDEIRAARMEGLPTYFGNVVSEHADRHLDLVGLGQLLALSHRPALNVLACQRYKAEFGAGRVFTVLTSEEKSTAEKLTITAEGAGRRLFGEEVTDKQLASLLGQGGEIRTTLLSEAYDFEAYQAHYHDRALPLFAVDDHRRLHVFVADEEPDVKSGWQVIGLIPVDLLEELEADEADGDDKS
jgi:CPA1 family monovalent cation:H+ antiporter